MNLQDDMKTIYLKLNMTIRKTKKILFRQSANKNTVIRMDNERGKITEEIINGNQTIIYENKTDPKLKFLRSVLSLFF